MAFDDHSHICIALLICFAALAVDLLKSFNLSRSTLANNLEKNSARFQLVLPTYWSRERPIGFDSEVVNLDNGQFDL
jgi:hypothetical protein